MEEHGKVKIKPESDLNCDCCLHQQRLGDWKADFCKDMCIRARYPEWLIGLWDVCGYAMKPIVGFGSVIFLLDASEFNEWMKGIGLDRENNLDDFEDIFVLAQSMVSLHQEYSVDTIWSKKEYKQLVEIYGDEERERSQG